MTDDFEWASLSLIADGFGFTEGPLWHPSGTLVFQDVKAATTHGWRPDTGVIVLRRDTGGANGQTFDAQGRIVFCEGALYGGRRRIGRIEPDRSVTTVADRWDGRRLNAPNDIVARSDGCLYFTNPRHIIPDEDADIHHSGVYRIDCDGSVTDTGVSLPLPNGLAFSPDERLLYVANTRPQPRIYVYEVDDHGNLGGERLFLRLPIAPEGPNLSSMLPDGLKVDLEGRLFVTAPGGVWVVEASGAIRAILRTPEWVTNLAFGDPDSRTLFLTCRDRVCSVRTRVPGIQPRGAAHAGPLPLKEV